MNPLQWLTSLLRREQPDLPKQGLTRRRFLQIMGSSAAVAAAAPALDLEALIWTPSTTIVVPEVGLVTVDWITREALKVLENNLQMTKLVNRQYDAAYDLVGIPVRVPMTKFVNSRSIGHRGIVGAEHVTFDYNLDEGNLTRDQARERLIVPAATALAERVKNSGATILGLPAGSPSETLALAMDSTKGVALRAAYDPLHQGVQLSVLTGQDERPTVESSREADAMRKFKKTIDARTRGLYT